MNNNYIRYKNNVLFVENTSCLKLAKKFKTPFYCYSLSTLKSNFNNFKKVFRRNKPLICFSVKSNANLSLLKELRKIGSGADVVSQGELLVALKAGINPKKIVFSGVGKTEEEIKLAIKKKILLINIESENEAQLINSISKKMSVKTSIGIRLNPNVTGTTNKKISTGGKKEKFGLLFNNWINLSKKIDDMKNLSLEGLSVHIGSQIIEIKPFIKLLSVISKLIKKADKKLKYIDLGGGIGIPYSKKERKVNMKKYSVLIEKLFKNKNVKIIFEPGRIISGSSGLLISKIIYIKRSGRKNFVILDAGMNDFIRPALYNAKHMIIPIKKNKRKIKGDIEFVGPVCESTDKFLNIKNFNKIKEGDFVVFTDVGAYGMSLSSNYNMRPIIAEIMVNNSKYKLVRKRQSLESLIKS